MRTPRRTTRRSATILIAAVGLGLLHSGLAHATHETRTHAGEPTPPTVTYTCPKKYTLSEDECVRTTVTYTCPDSSTRKGKHCYPNWPSRKGKTKATPVLHVSVIAATPVQTCPDGAAPHDDGCH